MLETLLIFPGLAVVGAAFTGWKASHPKVSLWAEKRRSTVIKRRRTQAIQAIWEQMPRDVMSIEDVRTYHHSHRGVYEYAAA